MDTKALNVFVLRGLLLCISLTPFFVILSYRLGLVEYVSTFCGFDCSGGWEPPEVNMANQFLDFSLLFYLIPLILMGNFPFLGPLGIDFTWPLIGGLFLWSILVFYALDLGLRKLKMSFRRGRGIYALIIGSGNNFPMIEMEQLYQKLISAGVEFERGLTENEFEKLETSLGVTFPPDYREFLGFALPVNKGFVNWRVESIEVLRSRIFDLPLEGILFDIERNDFWLEEWGLKPEDLLSALKLGREKFLEAPQILPINGHRYIPCEPSEPGNPIFSIHQTDIIYYGSDLRNYLENEFSYYLRGPNREYELGENIREIRFWSTLVNS